MTDFEKWFTDNFLSIEQQPRTNNTAVQFQRMAQRDNMENAYNAGREAAFDLVIERSADFDSHESFLTWCRLKRAGK